jgi:hypothetical protein
MKGIINKGVQELIVAKFGAEAWDKVKKLANCKEPFFSAGDDYPDQMTIDLANAASEVSKLPLETVLVEFGKFWVTHTGPQSYPTYFKLAGNTAREFLLNLNKVHLQVTKNINHAQQPKFEYEELPDGRLLMHYQSERKLCSVLRGLILGVGIYFDVELKVTEKACANNGDNQCTMEVTFNG